MLYYGGGRPSGCDSVTHEVTHGHLVKISLSILNRAKRRSSQFSVNDADFSPRLTLMSVAIRDK